MVHRFLTEKYLDWVAPLKSELPGRSFCISLPLADKERLSEEFVVVT